MSYELIPTNGRKSFYGKARVSEVAGIKTLTSYTTDVAQISPDGKFKKLWSGYSITTMNHINAFRCCNGMDIISKKEWQQMPVEREAK